MRRIILVVALVCALLATASAASSQTSYFQGAVYLTIKGWGSVKLGKGFTAHSVFRCTASSCPNEQGFAKAQRVTLKATPYKGWKFAGWFGACKKTRKRRRCVINLAHRRVRLGVHAAHIRAKFIAVAPGLTQANPIHLGDTKNIGDHFKLRVNSVTPNAQLSSPPPSGAEYFVANVTATYVGTGSTNDVEALANNLNASGSHKATYDQFSNACPEVPTPVFQGLQLYSGQSLTGNVCWTIATNDESSLELYLGSGFSNPGTTWFALH